MSSGAPGGDEGLHHVGQTGVMGAGGELSIGEGPGTALAKLDVGLRVQVAALPKGFHILDPLLQRLAPLQQNGPEPRFRQRQRRQQARRAAPHHHRRERRRAGHGGKHIGLRLRAQGDLLALGLGHHLLLVGDGHVHRHHIVDVFLFPGVDGLAHGMQR